MGGMGEGRSEAGLATQLGGFQDPGNVLRRL